MKTKKMICLLLTFVLIAGVLAPAAFAAAPPPSVTITGTNHWYPYYCTGNGVNIRMGPSTSYSSYGLLNYYDTFWHQMDANTSGFGYGKTGDSTAVSIAWGGAFWGWVSSSYLTWRDMI